MHSELAQAWLEIQPSWVIIIFYPKTDQIIRAARPVVSFAQKIVKIHIEQLPVVSGTVEVPVFLVTPMGFIGQNVTFQYGIACGHLGDILFFA